MKQNVLTILTIVILSLFVIGCSETVEELPIKPEETPEPAVEEPIEEPTEPVQETKEPKTEVTELPETTTEESNIKEFSITAKQWDFTPGTITVNKGDLIKLTVTSTDVRHGFKINEYNINEKFNKGETKVIEFTADKEGEFTFSCSVPCGSGHSSMSGKLVVE